MQDVPESIIFSTFMHLCDRSYRTLHAAYPAAGRTTNPAVCFILLFCYNVSRLQPHHLAYVYAHDKRYHKRDN